MRRDSHRKEVQDRKIHKETKEKETSLPRKLEYGFHNYLPIARPVSENEETVASHIKKLQEETRKRNVNKSLISALMDITFFDRRQSIVIRSEGVEEILQKYPCLVEEELLAEFGRLRPDPFDKHLYKQILEGLNKYGKGTLKAMDTTKTVPSWLKTFKCEASLEADENIKKALLGYAAVLGLPYLLGEDATSLLRLKTEEDPTLHILKSGHSYSSLENSTFQVQLEGQCIGRTTEMIQAFAMTVAAIYVFNLEYPEKLQKTFEFIHMNFLELPMTKVPRVVKNLAVKLVQ